MNNQSDENSPQITGIWVPKLKFLVLYERQQACGGHMPQKWIMGDDW